ncbi:MAG TPA: flagellar hook-basal body protein [Verrucomicrobiae bacterium]|jgi:flagellar basal body rod protein FlgG|nr:flagellar hook-basal body protein [Verrucomicrobiae bacterium]
MNVSLFQAAAALNSNSRWQDMIAENLASSSIPGFKKQELSVAAVQAGLMPQGAFNSSTGPQSFVLPVATSAMNFQQGELKFTGDKNDVAIEGPGFFSVQLPDGSTAQTRNGEFQVSAQGELVTNEGYAVLGDGGPILLDINNPEPISISATGVVSQGADEKGKLKLTQFDNPELLTPITAGYFLANNPKLVAQPSQSTVRQGYVESSNVSPVSEMSNLITAMRSFEANQRMIQIQDDRMGKAISELGNPN